MSEIRPPGWESLVEIMQVAMMIVVTIVVLAIVQPFLEPFEGVIVLAMAIVAMAIVTWRGVSRTLGQMREAARLIARALVVDDINYRDAGQAARGNDSRTRRHRAAAPRATAVRRAERLSRI